MMRTPAFSNCLPPSRRDEFSRRSGRRLGWRLRAGAQPLGLIGAVTAGALAGMMLAPASGSALASLDLPAQTVERPHTTPKTGRLRRAVVASPARIAAPPVPGACTPSPAEPARSGLIAYV